MRQLPLSAWILSSTSSIHSDPGHLFVTKIWLKTANEIEFVDHCLEVAVQDESFRVAERKLGTNNAEVRPNLGLSPRVNQNDWQSSTNPHQR